MSKTPTRECVICDKSIPMTGKPGRPRVKCKSCSAKPRHKSRSLKFSSKEKNGRKLRKLRKDLKKKHDVFMHISGGDLRCRCLGCDRNVSWEDLELDDVHGGGSRLSNYIAGGKKAAEGGRRGAFIYNWLLKKNYPEYIIDDDGKFYLCFQLLCSWCNRHKHKNSTCPLAGQSHKNWIQSVPGTI